MFLYVFPMILFVGKDAPAWILSLFGLNPSGEKPVLSSTAPLGIENLFGDAQSPNLREKQWNINCALLKNIFK